MSEPREHREQEGTVGGWRAYLHLADEALLAQCEVDRFRASGPGGQKRNKTDSAVRITHIPTGVVVQCQNERSQHKNRATAMKMLAAKLKDREREERESKVASERREQVGTGDRSERIRTYNFPQGRLTDHRINLTLYKLSSIMEGDLDDVVGALQAQEAADQLAALELNG